MAHVAPRSLLASARRALALALASLVLASPTVVAQRAPVAATTALDVIGPRSTGAVRTWLARSTRLLASCRGDEDVAVALSFAIAPDGSLLEVRAREAPELDARAAACTRDLVRTWRMPSRARSVTTVSWALVLRGTRVPCHCFSWVHLGDHGTSCERTASACAREAAAMGREHTPCSVQSRPRCEDDAFIDGVHVVRDEE